MESEIPQQSRSSLPGLGRESRARTGTESAWAPGGAQPAARAPAPGPKRTVCDHCRRRRIRCDGQFPCQHCVNASLTCKRDHIPRKRGPKRGHGRVINELRAQEAQGAERGSRESSSDLAEYGGMSTDGGDMSAPQTAPNSVPSSPPDTSGWTDGRTGYETRGSIYTSDQYRPTSRSYLYLIPQCVELYYEHIYPIMPLVYMPAIRAMVSRTMNYSERNVVYALCALTCLHMRGKSIQATATGPDSWEAAGRFFLDECMSVRQSYDFLEDESLYAVISSFWVSTSFFEIHQDRKSWFYLKEALHLALELGLDDDSTYAGLSPEEKLCRQRVFWILFVTERSFAILRYKHITFKKTPSLPTTRHWYEAPDIHSGFRQLISSYEPLDESFVAAWNEKSDPAIRNASDNSTLDDEAYRALQKTFLTLQNLQDRLARPLAFLTRSTSTIPSPQGTAQAYEDVLTPTPNSGLPNYYQQTSTTPTKAESGDVASSSPFSSTPVAEDTDPEPTAIQKADLLITQQWLRLIVWRKAEQRKLLSWHASHESMNVAFPFDIARQTVAILESLPSTAVEVHGMGIFEKIFKIGISYVDTLSAHELAGRGNIGTDILSPGRRGFAIDPLEFLVKILSATPNSRTKFAEELAAYAGRLPGGLKLTLSPQPNLYPAPWQPTAQPYAIGAPPTAATGTIIGEVTDEDEADQQAIQPSLAATQGMPIPTGQPMQYNSGYDVAMISPTVPGGFGDAGPPGLGSGVLWQAPPILTTTNWAVNPSNSESSSTGFAFGQHAHLPPVGFPYESYNGENLAASGNAAYPAYSSSQGMNTTPMGQQNIHEANRKRGWDSIGNWQA